MKNVLEETLKSILPFSTRSENRKEPFTKKIERATIFCLAELERSKGGGLVLKQPPEKLTFIAEVCYPFWLVTLDKTGLIFDGLCAASQTLTYSTIPDIQVFLDNIKRSSKTRQAYMTFLSDNINYFQVPQNEEIKAIDGLIADPEFLEDFTSYLSEAAALISSMSNMVTISPTLDESSIVSIVEEVQSLKSKFAEEFDALCTSMKLLSAKTEDVIKAIRTEIKKTEQEISEEINECKASFEEQVDQISKDYDEKVTEYSRAVEEELLSMQQEKIKIEKTKEQLTRQVEHCEAEIKTCAINKDGVGEQKWKEEKDKFKEQLSKTETKLKELDRSIRDVKDEKNLKIFELKSEREAKTKESMKDLIEIESSRDAKIRICEEEMEKFEELTSSIVEQIDNLAKLREKSIEEFEKLGFQQERKEKTLIYMPFYLACYQSGTRKRYVPFPPPIVSNVSFPIKFKSALGKAKIKQLLHPRSQKIVSHLNRFPVLMEQDVVFKREMNEACAKADILRSETLRESNKIGLIMLKEEGWLSEREYESFSEILE